jgi:uncharacterized protein involved in oxidation of intracellular sulfur
MSPEVSAHMTTTSKQILFVLNEGPYGSERPYNALRHAMELAKDPEFHVRVFLVGDAVQCAVAGQETHEGFYNVERMMSSLARRGEVAT